MLKLIIFLFCIVGVISLAFTQTKQVKKNGMEVAWEIQESILEVEVFAPQRGWIAIGFNETERLQGTHLMMGSISKEQIRLSDRYILKPGVHKSMEELGAKSALTLIEGKEDTKGTTLSFSFPLDSSDKYHKNLIPGQEYTLLLAYSREDDFAHHSMMRTSVKIIL